MLTNPVLIYYIIIMYVELCFVCYVIILYVVILRAGKFFFKNFWVFLKEIEDNAHFDINNKS